MMVGPGAVRDLIEAGLNEPADAAPRYGISVARPVPGARLGVIQWRLVGEDEAATPMSTEAIDAPVGIFGSAAGNACALRVGRPDGGHGASLHPSALMP